MRRFFSFALLGLLGLAATSRAACLNGCCPTCKPIPAPECEDCSCACDHRCHLMLHDKSQQYIDALHCPDSTCCDRIKAAKKLGCRLHADYCCNPAVLDALLGALTCDPCWEVRQAAAESIYLQDARTEQSVLVLYVSSKVDPHYMVRTEAAEALDIITRCRHNCYKDLYAHADDLIKELKKQKFKPGTENCQLLFGAACAVLRRATRAAGRLPRRPGCPGRNGSAAGPQGQGGRQADRREDALGGRRSRPGDARHALTGALGERPA